MIGPVDSTGNRVDIFLPTTGSYARQIATAHERGVKTLSREQGVVKWFNASKGCRFHPTPVRRRRALCSLLCHPDGWIQNTE